MKTFRGALSAFMGIMGFLVLMLFLIWVLGSLPPAPVVSQQPANTTLAAAPYPPPGTTGPRRPAESTVQAYPIGWQPTPIPTPTLPVPPTISATRSLDPKRLPTPAPPLTTTPQITAQQAVEIVMADSPSYAALQARGEVTVTTRLTTYGVYYREVLWPGKAEPDIQYMTHHPTLPVWLVTVETKPWTQWAGPAGAQQLVTFKGTCFVIDAVSGEKLGGYRISVRSEPA